MTSKAPEDVSTHSLGEFLANIRTVKGLTLREVEEASQQQVSNAYLSQLENNKISKPSPHILHSLAQVYAVPYEILMEKAGYITSTVNVATNAKRKHGRAATYALDDLSKEEEDALLNYLAFLRFRKK